MDKVSEGSVHNAVLGCAGYMVSRMLGAAPVLADAVVEAVCRGRDAAADAHRPLGASSEPEAEALSAAVWHAIWPVERCGGSHLADQCVPVMHDGRRSLGASPSPRPWRCPPPCGTPSGPWSGAGTMHSLGSRD